MKQQLLAFMRSFGYAFQGIWTLVRTQRNARVHLLAVAVVGVSGLVLEFSATEWMVVTLLCTLVLALEAVNTAIEAVVDLVSPHYHPLAKQAKDVAAGAVLLAAIGACIIALLLIGTRI